MKCPYPLPCNVQTICLFLVLQNKYDSIMIFEGSLSRLFIRIHFTDLKSSLHTDSCSHAAYTLSDFEISSQTLINRILDYDRPQCAFWTGLARLVDLETSKSWRLVWACSKFQVVCDRQMTDFPMSVVKDIHIMNNLFITWMSHRVSDWSALWVHDTWESTSGRVKVWRHSKGEH